jgi:hypothetical protein
MVPEIKRWASSKELIRTMELLTGKGQDQGAGVPLGNPLLKPLSG